MESIIPLIQIDWQASDEMEYVTTIRASLKIRGFAIYWSDHKDESVRVVGALSTNALEVHAIKKQKQDQKQTVPTVEDVKLLSMDMYGHATGIRRDACVP